MPTPSGPASSGSADLQGDLWGARAEAWSEHEVQGRPIFEEVLRRTGVGDGTRLLDLGCASGTLCRLAADRGARVFGLDAAETLIAIARRRVPEGEFGRGDIQFLPYEDGAFDVVTAVNSLQFAADSAAAVREAARVARPGGAVAVALWGPPDEVELFVPVRAVSALMPGPPPTRTLLEPGALERALAEAELTARESVDGRVAFEFADAGEMLRQMSSAGGTVRAISVLGDDAVQRALLEAMEPFRTPEGGYRLRNAWRLVVSTR